MKTVISAVLLGTLATAASAASAQDAGDWIVRAGAIGAERIAVTCPHVDGGGDSAPA